MPALTEDTRVRTSIQRLVTIGVTLMVIVAGAMTMWNKQVNDVSTLSSTVADHARQLEGIQHELRAVQINQSSQTEILKYLARDRRGPVPEAAK